MTRDFVTAVRTLAQQRGIAVVPFERGPRKQDVARPSIAAVPARAWS